MYTCIRHAYATLTTLLDLMTGKETNFHVSDVATLVFEAVPVIDPADIARRDFMEYYVDTVASNIKLEISWLDYPPGNNAWESYKNLRQNSQLHAYLAENNLHKHKLIPREFQ